MTRHARVLAALLLALIAAPASAQDGVDWGGLMGTIAQGSAMEEAARESGNATAPRRTAPAPRATLGYTFSPDRRQANIRRMVERTRARNPRGAAELAKLADPSLLARVDAIVRRHGGSTRNLADVYALWWIDAWNAANSRNPPFDDRQFAAVRGQAARALARVPAVASGNEAARQELADTLLVQAMVIEALLDGGDRDPAIRRSAATQVRRGAGASGLDLDRMTLTAAGFVPAR